METIVRAQAGCQSGSALPVQEPRVTVFQRQPLLVPVQHGVPRTRALDSTLPLLLEGYPFIQRHCAELRSDIFSLR